MQGGEQLVGGKRASRSTTPGDDRHRHGSSKCRVQEQQLHHLPGQPVPIFNHVFCEDIFPGVQPKPLLAQLKTPAVSLVACQKRPTTTWQHSVYRWL